MRFTAWAWLALLPWACAAQPIETNRLGMRLVKVPAGEFWMGSADSPEALARDFPQLEPQRFQLLGDERPRHRVRISRAFWLGQHEVTVGQWRRFLAESGHVPESIADGTGGYGWRADYDPATTRRGDAFEGRSPRYSWAQPGFPQGEDHPVTNVSWNDAQALAAWLTRVEGRRYRLPTEAEWEYACRAGSSTRYPGGDQPEALRGQANVFAAETAALWPQWRAQALPGEDGHVFTAPVGRYGANAFGLHDMLGNVWEWVQDWHDDDSYARHAAAAGPDGVTVDPRGPAEGGVRVRRGGSWHTWPFYARCGYRNWNDPGTRYVLVGIRLLREDAPTPDVAPSAQAPR